MIRVITVISILLIALFGTLLYIKYGKQYQQDGFVDIPKTEMGKIPVVTGESSIPNTMPGSTVSDPDKPTLSDLENTLSRIEFEKRSLLNLRSPAENIKSRISVLDKVKSDLTEYISKIKRNKININDVPFTKRDLGAFLLIKDDNLSTKTNSSKTTSALDNEDSNNLFDNLKWNVSVEYDPNIKFLKTISSKMETIDKELRSKKLDHAQVNSKMLELKILEQQAAALNKRSITRADNNLKAYTHNSIENSEQVPHSSVKKPFFMDQTEPSEELTKYAQKEFTNSANKEFTESKRQFPEQYHDYTKRVSASSFDNDSVAGPDYKKKVDFLCYQIKNAELGNPTDFGCINNPETDVSKDYSWRGNYKMVCNRLGRIWGGWYPEMFGCPKVVGTDEQAPVIFESNK